MIWILLAVLFGCSVLLGHLLGDRASHAHTWSPQDQAQYDRAVREHRGQP